MNIWNQLPRTILFSENYKKINICKKKIILRKENIIQGFALRIGTVRWIFIILFKKIYIRYLVFILISLTQHFPSLTLNLVVFKETILFFIKRSESELNESEPCLKSAKNRFQLSAGLNIETFNRSLSHKWNQPNLRRASNSINSASKEPLKS